MSIWDRIRRNTVAFSPESARYAIVDAEVGINNHKVQDIGALRYDGAVFHQASKEGLIRFLRDVDFVCGHNLIHHDATFLFKDVNVSWVYVDTLYVSPLLFPERPYHKLVKDDKLISEQANNPVNDCEKARELLWDEISRWRELQLDKQLIYSSLLSGQKEFSGFLKIVGAPSPDSRRLSNYIKNAYDGRICQNADIDSLIRQWPVALAYALALIDTTDFRSNTPAWVIRNYPEIEYVMKLLRHNRCAAGCNYCLSQLDDICT